MPIPSTLTGAAGHTLTNALPRGELQHPWRGALRLELTDHKLSCPRCCHMGLGTAVPLVTAPGRLGRPSGLCGPGPPPTLTLASPGAAPLAAVTRGAADVEQPGTGLLAARVCSWITWPVFLLGLLVFFSPLVLEEFLIYSEF